MRYNIHCEQIYDDEVWNNLVRLLKKKGRKCYLFLIAPQITYVKSDLGYRGTKEELAAKLKERYNILARVQSKYKFKIGLHLHLSLHPHKLSEAEKDQSVKYVYNWINRFQWEQRQVTGISFGWFKYDNYIEELCDVNRLKIVNDEWGAITFHDYDLPLTTFKSFEKWLRVFLRKVKGQKPKR